MKELTDKVTYGVDKTLGKEINEMMYLSQLVTDPDYQGRGLGSALVRNVNKMVRSVP